MAAVVAMIEEVVAAASTAARRRRGLRRRRRHRRRRRRRPLPGIPLPRVCPSVSVEWLLSTVVADCSLLVLLSDNFYFYYDYSPYYHSTILPYLLRGCATRTFCALRLLPSLISSPPLLLRCTTVATKQDKAASRRERGD